ncbi:MAG: AraC family transcriptional regulator [Oscillospiraceae bacterium]|nr:AraC family transcriptional regulator [Oscillospiraceae bacterium]
MNNNPAKKLIRIRNTPSAIAADNLLYVQEVGCLPAELASETQQRQIDSYLVFFVLKGQGYLKYDGIEYRVSEGRGVFIDCHTEHSFRCDPDDPWEVLWLHFNGNSAPYYYRLFQKKGFCIFLPQNIKDFVSVIYETIANNAHKTNDTEIINSKLITDILTMILSNPGIHGPSDDYSYQMKSVKEYIDSHFTESINLDELSEAFYINKYYLTREFKKEYGETIFQHIINRRIEYAKNLLSSTDKTIEEISLLSGFNDQSYFSRQFKKMVGVSSLNYRKEHKKCLV